MKLTGPLGQNHDEMQGKGTSDTPHSRCGEFWFTGRVKPIPVRKVHQVAGQGSQKRRPKNTQDRSKALRAKLAQGKDLKATETIQNRSLAKGHTISDSLNSNTQVRG